MNTILLLIILYLLLHRDRCCVEDKRVSLTLKDLRRDHNIEVLFRDRR